MEKFFFAKELDLTEYQRQINLWLSHNPNIIPRRLLAGEFSETSSGNFKCSFEFTLDYEIAEDREIRYSFCCIEVKSFLKQGLDYMKDAWRTENPSAQIVLCSYLHGFTEDGEQIEKEGTTLPNCNRLWILFTDNREFSDSDEMSIFDEGYVAPEGIEPEDSKKDELPCESETEENPTAETENVSESERETSHNDMVALMVQSDELVNSIQITDVQDVLEVSEIEEQDVESDEEKESEEKTVQFGVNFCRFCGTKLSELQQRYCIFCGKDVIDINKNIPTK